MAQGVLPRPIARVLFAVLEFVGALDKRVTQKLEGSLRPYDGKKEGDELSEEQRKSTHTRTRAHTNTHELAEETSEEDACALAHARLLCL